MEKIGFVVLTWNSERVIERCLNSICALKLFTPLIFIVDNGSSDSTATILQYYERSYDCIDVTYFGKNMGTTISRNIALKKCLKFHADFICILDSDTVVNDEALLSMKTRLLLPNVGIVGPVMEDENGVVQNSGRKVPTMMIKLFKVLPIKALKKKGESLELYIYEKVGCRPVGYLMSACWLFKKSLLDNVGLLDEKIFYAPEDVDFCLCCWEQGNGVYKDYDAKIIHSWQRISRKKLFSRHNVEHIKGLLYLFRKHHFFFSASKYEEKVAQYRTFV